MRPLIRSASLALGLFCLATTATAANLEPTVYRGNVVVEKAEIGIVVGLDESNAIRPSDDWLDRAWVLQSDLPTKEHIYFNGPAEVEVTKDSLVLYLNESQSTMILRLNTIEDPEVSENWGEPSRFEGFGLITLTPPTRRVALLATASHYGFVPNPHELSFPLKNNPGPFHDDTGDGCGMGPDDPDPNCAGEDGGGGTSGGTSNGCSKSCSATCQDGSSCSVSCAAYQKASCSNDCALSGTTLTCRCINCY